MTPAGFRAAVARTRLSLNGRATYGALLVLVGGKSMTRAAVESRCSRQAIAVAILSIGRATKRCPYCGAKLRRLK